MSMVAVESALEEVGLTKNECLVYIALLKLKTGLAGEITSRSGVHRRNVYDALERLQGKGLVSSTLKNNRKHFQPERPARLRELLKEKEDRLEKALPALDELLGKSARREAVTVYTGAAGYKSLEEDILATLPAASELYAIPAVYRLPKLVSTFMKFVHKRRVEKRITLKAIYNNDEKSVARAIEVSKMPLTKVRIMPLAQQAPAGINIYGSKCAITVVDENEEPIAIVFDNRTITQTFKHFFDALWKQAKLV